MISFVVRLQMKARYFNRTSSTSPMTSNERKAMMDEIKRQCVEINDQYLADLDAVILFILHDKYGFGPKRLRKFWEEVKLGVKELQEYYCMPDDAAWLAKYKLKEIGVDIDAWEKEN